MGIIGTVSAKLFTGQGMYSGPVAGWWFESTPPPIIVLHTDKSTLKSFFCAKYHQIG